MAKSLNVLIGATLDSNVTKNLNAELEKLNLNKVEIQLGFDKASVDGIKDAIKQSLTSAFNGISFVENEAKDIGQAIGENIAKGMQSSKKQITRHLNDVVKETDKAADKITTKLTHAYSVGNDGKKRQVGAVVEFDYNNGFKEIYSEKEVKGNLVKKYTAVDDTEKIAAREEAKQIREATKARKEQEKAEAKYYNIRRKWREEDRKAEEKATMSASKKALDDQRKQSQKYYIQSLKWAEAERKAEEKAFLDELYRKKKESAKQRQEEEKAIIREYDAKEKEEQRLYQQQLKLNSDIIERQRKAREKEENDLLKSWEKEYEAEAKAKERARKEQEKADEQQLKIWQKEYDAKEKEEQRLYQQKLKLNSQVDEYNRNNQEKLKKTYKDTYSSLAKVQKEAGSYDSDVYGAKAQKQIESYRKKVLGLTAVINDEKSSIEEVARATERLAKLQKAIEGFGSRLANQQSNKTWYHTQLDEWNKQTDREVTRLKSQYGSAFNESEYRKARDLETEALKIIKKQGYAKEEILAIQKKLNSNTKTFTTNLRASSKELKDIREKADLLDSSLGRFIQFYGFGQLFGAMKRAFSDIAVNIKDIDSSMTELKKVSTETEYVYDRFLDGAAEKAKALGTSLKDYIDSVTEFKRMGYDFQESQVIAETANVMQMVSESLTGEDSAQYLISIMAAYGIEAKKSMDIVDKLNNVDRRSRLETSGQTLSFYRETSRNGRPIPRIRLFCACALT